jgi:hypothetical protein
MNRIKAASVASLAIGTALVAVVPTAAQTLEVADAPAFVSGSIVDGSGGATERTTVGDGFTLIEVEAGPDRWESTDERLSGEVTYRGQWRRYPDPAGMQVETATYELLNDGGRWVGEATALATAGIPGWDTIVFAGEDGYEGLTAYVVIDWDSESEDFFGAIFPGQMPTIPAD